MRGSDIFDLYRQLLAIVVTTYVTVRTVNFIWRWQVTGDSVGRLERLCRQYLVVQALRVRLRRFLFDLLQVAALVALFGWLVWLHWR